jgi:ferricrocin synthase
MSSDSTVGTIGVPLDTVSAFVIAPFDEAQPFADIRILPRGESGELAVGGYQLADGYLNRPEQTDAAFLNTPYGRIYRTGDKARIHEDGTLECLGRLSEGQVKLRGQRMELGEVEAAVLRTQGCHGARAMVHESILVCFCAVDDSVSEDDLVSSCERWLPKFMIPGEFVLLRGFPRLPSGKVDKKQLLAGLISSRQEADTANERHRWKVGQFPDEIQDIISGIFGTGSNRGIGSLDSLSAIRLASSLRTYGCDMSVLEILRIKSIGTLHTAMVEKLGTQSTQAVRQLPSFLGEWDSIIAENAGLDGMRDLIEDIFPSTPLQKAMVSESVQHPGAYWNEIELVMEPGVTIEQITDALVTVAQSNEILRTGFVMQRGDVLSVLFSHLDRSKIVVVNEFESSQSRLEAYEILSTWNVQIKPPAQPEAGLGLLISIHHAIYDGWSFDMLLSDLSDLVRGLSPPVRPSFRDVIAFYQLEKHDAIHPSSKFWAESLHGWTKSPFPKLMGTVDNSKEPVVTLGVIDISPTSLVEASAAIGCSPQVFFQASLARIWSGILGSLDIVLGTVTSGRAIPVAGVEMISGPCIASLPLRVDLSRISDTAHLLNHIHASNRGMIEHGTISLSEIKKFVGIQPGESLYDVLFVYQESPDSKGKNDHALKEVRHLDRLETKLVVEIEPQEEKFSVQMTYHPGSLTAGLAEVMIGQLGDLVSRLLQSPEGSFSALGRSLHASPSTYNLKPQTMSEEPDLASMFETVAARVPSATAICFASRDATGRMNQENMTYDELNALSNRIAHLLRAEGVVAGGIVPVVLEKSFLLYASILGVVKAGCAYLPLLPSTPIDRMRRVFSQAKVATCLADNAASDNLESIQGLQVLNVEASPLGELPAHSLGTSVDGSRLAYVIFTSGTTGEPKGVAVTQLNIASNIAHLEKTYPKADSKQSRLLQACSQAFDVSVFEIFYTWYAGMCLCTGINDVLFEDLESSIRELDITHLSLTPTVASLIDPQKVPGVEFLVTAGEPMTQSVLQKWGPKLWQGYGPSETTNICTVKRMSLDAHIEHLGWTFANTSVVVLLPDGLEVAPIGWVGEFCFGGDQVVDGYLNLPRTTARSFIQHREFGRIYRSGDIGRMLPDGSLIILGRIDSQLKLRGQRIEAGEIESLITSTRLAGSAVAMLVRRPEIAADQLVAFYTPPGEHDVVSVAGQNGETNRRLFTALQSRLPSYMIPSFLVAVPSIQLTSSGKVDRKGLESWFLGLTSEEVEATANQTLTANEGDWSEIERTVARAISTSLGIPAVQIQRWTPFATLGLDSVTSIALARQLKDTFQVRIPISAILRNPNVATLASCISSDGSVKEVRGASTFFSQAFVDETRTSFTTQSKTVGQVLPCTPLQEAMLSSGHLSYYNKVILRLQIPIGRMKAYWAEMVRRHGILRTCFVTTSDVKHPIAQVVLEDWTIPWLEFDVVTPSFDGVINDHLSTLPNPVDSLLPPVSLAEIRYRGSTFLSFICHHSLYDGIAMDNLWREVETLANDRPLTPVVPYEQFLKESLTLPGDVEEFWKAQLVDWRPATLFRKSTSRRTDQVTTTTYLNKSLSDLRGKIQSMGVSLLSLCQAAWANTLAIAHDGPDVCFGNVVNGRTIGIEDIDYLIAPCFNTVPVRKDISTHIHRMDLVKSFHSLASEIVPYQFTPLRLIQKAVSRQGLGLFDTLLLLQHPLREMDDSVWILESDSSEMNIPLVCEVVPCPGLDSTVVNIQYDMNVVTSDIASTLAAIFVSQLEEILESPYAKLTTRQALPPKLSDGLGRLVTRREKPVATRAPSAADEDWTEVELLVRQVLSELSAQPLARIQKHTTIFQLGLDSINAVQVAAMLRRRGLGTSASDVMEYPTCERLAVRFASSSKDYSARTRTSGSAYDLTKFREEVASQLQTKLPSNIEIESVLPCTPLQSAMMASFIESKGQNYFNLMTYDVDSSIGLSEISGAWESLFADHSMLRTGLVAVNHPDTAFAMVRHSASQGTAPITSMSAADASTISIDYFQGNLRAEYIKKPHLPPWHVLLVDVLGKVTMTLFIHHVLYDADSLAALLQRLTMILRNRPTIGLANVEASVIEVMSTSLNPNPEAEEFWKGKTAETVVNPFPIMTPLRETDSAMKALTIESKLSFSSLKTATLNAGVTVQAVLQAAWTRILTSYIGENSITFGVTLSARTSEATKQSSLPCLSTLPIVAANHPSNRGLLDSMMNFNAAAHRFRAVPLAQVQKWLGHPASPVFDTLLSYRKVPKNHGPDQLFELVQDTPTIDYPVSMEVEGVEGGEIRLTVTYKPGVIPAEQVELLLQQFDAIMGHIALYPAGTEDELHKARQDIFSVLPPAVPHMDAPVKYLHEFAERSAAQIPHVIALEFYASLQNGGEQQQWTYHELNELGNRVAHCVREKAAQGSIVAIHFDKCPEAYFSILGILKAGCSFVALDPSAPKARKEFILQDSKAPCLLTLSSELDFASAAEVVQITAEALDHYPSTPYKLDASFDESNTCYCLYTSGTTGTPKGCEITHENSVQAMMAFQELFRGHWQADSRWLQFAALHFDVSVLEQYWSWSVGITVVAAPKDVILDDLTGSINKLRITHIDLTPSLARLTHPDEVPTLCRGVFITGGESLKQEILDVWGPQAVIYNAYGPTEATIGVTMYQRVPVNGRPSNIGQQFLNVGSYVFRPGAEIPVLRGGVGELCVSGKLVGKGYLGRPELTEERFPTLTSDQFRGERVYRTGDLVRLLHDGCFEFLGRADDQIKLRGQRLEIGEINHAMKQVPEIHDVATIVASKGGNDKAVLVAFLVSASARGDKERGQMLEIVPDAESLGAKAREACRSKLPGYMVPSYFLRVPFIPLSANNKAEVKELRRVFEEIAPTRLIELNTSAAPEQTGVIGELSKKILATLADFSGLNLAELHPTMSIFDAGVDSISALRLTYLLKDKGLKTATPALVLRNPVVSDLAKALSQDHQSSQNNERQLREARQLVKACRHRYRALACQELGVRLDEIEYIAPCSPLQQGMLSKSLTSVVEGSYFNTFELRLHPHVSTESLERAFQSLVASEAILRTVFLSTTDGHIQVALKRPKSPWAICLVQGDEDALKIAKRKRSEWLAANKINVTEPLQLILLEGGEARTLLINIFHAVYDGISLDLMLRRVARSMADAQQALLGKAPPSFMEALVHGPLWKFESCRAFWEEHLRGWNYSPVPSLGTSTAPQQVSVASASRTLDYTPLEEVRKAHGVTLQAVALTLWTSVLQQYYPNGGLTIGIIVSGRSIELENVEGTIGPLFNTLPLRVSSVPGQSWSGRMKECHDWGTSVLPFQHAPLHRIQKWCSGGQALFDNLFTLHYSEDQGSPDGAPPPWDVVEGDPNPDYPLALEIHCNSSGSMKLSIAAQGHIADDVALERLLDLWVQSVETLVANPDAPLDTTARAVVSTSDKDSSNTQSLGSSTQSTSTGDYGSFIWTPTATAISEEVAQLAGDDVEIQSSTTMLELGLDSIDVIKLSARLKKRNISIAASQIMQLQSVAGMARTVDEAAESESPSAESIGPLVDMDQLRNQLEAAARRSRAVDFQKHAIERVLPPTALQESMVGAMIQSDFEWYFNHDIAEVQDDVDLGRLRRAWEEVVATHPVLRTGFVEVEDEALDMAYCQVVFREAQPWQGEFFVSDLQDGMAILLEEATATAKAGQGSRDLVQIRSVVLECGHRFLLLSLAHALYDGWSLGLIHEEVRRAYYGQSLKSPSHPDQFLRKILEGQTQESRDFWREYLQGVSPTVVSSNSATSGETELWTGERQSSQTKAAILEFCKRQKISLQVLCQACWAVVLATWTKQLDVVFGMVMSGRDSEGADNLVFPTMNTVASRCVLHGSVSELLGYLEEEGRHVRRYQGVPLRKVKAGAHATNMELFNSLFMLQRTMVASGDDTRQPPLTVSVDGSSAVDYPICVEAEALEEAIIWRVACQTRIIDREDGEKILRDLQRVMSFFTTSPEAETLEFVEGGVSVCGLEAFALESKEDGEDDLSEDKHVRADMEPMGGERATMIMSVLSQVSGISSVDIKSSYTLYNLGLDSISAIKVSTLLRKRGLSLSVRDLVRAGDVRDMVAHATTVTDDLANGHPASAQQVEDDGALSNWCSDRGFDMSLLPILTKHGLSTSDIEIMLPALPMQVYMLSAWQNAAGAVFYPGFAFEIRRARSEDDMWRAWRAVVASTPILRTCFVTTTQTDLPVLQLVLTSDAVWRQQKLEHEEHGVLKPMVDMVPEWRASDKAWVLRLRIHHALYDGVSLPAIMQLLIQQLDNLGTAEDALGNSVSVGVVDHTPWMRYCIRPTLGTAVAKRRQFWMDYLGQRPSLPALTGQQPPPSCDVSGAVEGHQAQSRTEPARSGYPIERVSHLQRSAVSRTELQLLRQNATSRGVSLQSLFLAAWAKCLVDMGDGFDINVDTGVHRDSPSSHSEIGVNPHGTPRRSVVFGIYRANRSDDGGQDGLHFTFPRLNLVPLRVDLGNQHGADEEGGKTTPVTRGGRSLWDVAGRVQRDLIRMSSSSNQEDDVCDVGLWEVEEWTGWKMDSFVNFLSLPGEEDEGDKAFTVAEAPAEAAGAPRAEESSRTLVAGETGDVHVRDAFPVSDPAPLLPLSPVVRMSPDKLTTSSPLRTLRHQYAEMGSTSASLVRSVGGLRVVAKPRPALSLPWLMPCEIVSMSEYSVR